jgi:hypothetical protein
MGNRIIARIDPQNADQESDLVKKSKSCAGTLSDIK